LWFGWFGFNGGSELAADARAVNACVVSHLSASVGGMTWLFLEFWRTDKLSSAGFCAGAVAGLVAITPASGFVSPASSLVFGAVGAAVCFGATKIKEFIKVDDAYDVFAVHGVGGATGSILTGIFAQNSIATMSGGAPIKGGWLDRNWDQLGWQIAGVLAIGSWSFVVTYLIVGFLKIVPKFHPRLTKEAEERGDVMSMGEQIVSLASLTATADAVEAHRKAVSFRMKTKANIEPSSTASSSAESRVASDIEPNVHQDLASSGNTSSKRKIVIHSEASKSNRELRSPTEMAFQQVEMTEG